MKVLFKHPGTSGYSDNRIWMNLNNLMPSFWFHPGQNIAILTDKEVQKLEEADPPDDPGQEYEDFCRTFKSSEWDVSSIRENYAFAVRAQVQLAQANGWQTLGRLHKLGGTWIQYMKRPVVRIPKEETSG